MTGGSLPNNYGHFTPPTPPNSESSECSLIHDGSQTNFAGGEPKQALSNSSHLASSQAPNGQQLINATGNELNNLSQQGDSILNQLNSSIASHLGNLSSSANQLIKSCASASSSPSHTKSPVYTLSSSTNPLVVSTSNQLASLSRHSNSRPATSLAIKNESKFSYFNSPLSKSPIYGYPIADKLHFTNYSTFNGANHLEPNKLGDHKTSQTELIKPANGRIVSKRRNNPELERRRIHKCLFNGCSKSYTKSSHLKVRVYYFRLFLNECDQLTHLKFIQLGPLSLAYRRETLPLFV